MGFGQQPVELGIRPSVTSPGVCQREWRSKNATEGALPCEFATSLAEGIGRTHFRYSQYINRFHKRSGRLWQGRFYSCALDDRHLFVAMKYVELNPVLPRLCRRAWRYEWSSAAAHTDEEVQPELLNLSRWHGQLSAESWKKELAKGVSKEQAARIRVRTQTGRPLGSDGFVSKLEMRLGRRVRPLPVGRPRKQLSTQSRGGRKAKKG